MTKELRQSLYDKKLESLQELTEIRQLLWKKWEQSGSIDIFDAHSKVRIAELETKAEVKHLLQRNST